MGSPSVSSTGESAIRYVAVIGAACGAGAPDPSTTEGPDALRRYRAFHDTPLQHVAWEAILRVPRGARDTPLHAVAALSERLAHEVEKALHAGHFPLVVGGDHSCAIGTWSGVHRALAAKGPIGLIWIDAHLDSHTFATSPSGRIHGMPLAALLSQGEATLTSIGGAQAKLLPEHVCVIGARSYEASEAALLERLGVRVFAMEEVRRRGLAAVFDDALAIMRRAAGGYGVSVDLDALDPDEAPGTGTPVAGGLKRDELAAALARLANDPAFLAMEIAEYNPRRDHGYATAKAVGALVDAIAPCQQRAESRQPAPSPTKGLSTRS